MAGQGERAVAGRVDGGGGRKGRKKINMKKKKESTRFF